MIANSNNFFFECDRSNSNAKIPHATVGRAAPATNRRRQSFTASLTCATRAGSSLLTAAVINTTHKTRPKAFKNIRALINRCPTGEHPFITRDWLFQPSLPCADQQDQRADPCRMMRPRFADSIGQQSVWAASKGRTHDCKRPLCCTPNYLLPGGGHPHMKRREFITLLGSAAAAWPLAARAQQGQRVRLVCILEGLSADTPGAKTRYAAFLEGLQQLGWTPGRNVQIEVRWGEGDEAAIRKYAAELVALAPDVLVAGGGAAAEVVLKVTHTIPIVFVIVPDPVGSGFVESLSQPGANATGFMMFEYNLCGKWLELLKEIAPSVTHAAVLRRCRHCCRDRPVRCHSSCGAIGRHRGKSNRLARAGPDRTRHRNLRAEVEWRNDPDGESNRSSQCQFDHRSGRTVQAASGLRSTTLCCCRRIDLLWAEFSGPIPTRG